jgi:hypothetical protein
MATQQQIDELTRKMADERGKLLTALESMDEAALQSSPVEGEWNSKQQMSHLCEMESAYRAWVHRAIEEDGANVDGIYGEPPSIPLEDADNHSGAQHIAEMRRQRAKTMRVIEALTLDDYVRTATSKMFGTLTVMQWLRSYYRHDRMHVDQLSGKDPEYKPRFQSGAEPDQRRG